MPTDPYAPLAGLDWQPGPPIAPGLWWVDRGRLNETRKERLPRACYGVIVWRHDRATARWLEPERYGVAVGARQLWPEGWRVAPVEVGQIRQAYDRIISALGGLHLQAGIANGVQDVATEYCRMRAELDAVTEALAGFEVTEPDPDEAPGNVRCVPLAERVRKLRAFTP